MEDKSNAVFAQLCFAHTYMKQLHSCIHNTHTHTHTHTHTLTHTHIHTHSHKDMHAHNTTYTRMRAACT